MRVFFGLGLDAETQSEIDGWLSKCLPPFFRPVVQYNFHLTLAFLGNVTPMQLKSVVELGERVQASTFTLRLSQMGYWPRQEIVYLAPSHVPCELIHLAEEAKQLARRSGLRVERRAYRPHLTLARRCKVAPPAPLMQPDFEISVEEFRLFESVRRPSGVVYKTLETFYLN